MRFIALLKKELRECLPWLILAAIVFAFFGSVSLQSSASLQRHYGRVPDPGVTVRYYELTERSLLSGIGLLLFTISVGLGLVLGGRQFWMPHFIKTWAFTIHRSTRHSTILCAKFGAAITAFILGLGVIWTLFYFYTSKPGLFPYPPRSRGFIEGWILIILGLLVYFGAALSGLSEAKWYTTKIFGIAFAAVVLMLAPLWPSLAYCFVIIIVSLVVMLSQIIYTFQNREF